jgi:hypothetical protein
MRGQRQASPFLTGRYSLILGKEGEGHQRNPYDAFTANGWRVKQTGLAVDWLTMESSLQELKHELTKQDIACNHSDVGETFRFVLLLHALLPADWRMGIQPFSRPSAMPLWAHRSFFLSLLRICLVCLDSQGD